MLMTNQQHFLMEALEILGGAELRQLTELLRPVFCAEKPEVAARVVQAAIGQMRRCNIELCQEGEPVVVRGRRPGPLQLEAVDVMLELAGTELLNYRGGKPPILLRFSVQGQKAKLFAVTVPGADLYGIELHETERIIQLFDGQNKAHALSVPNKQFIAVRQDDGTHRFFAADGQTDRR